MLETLNMLQREPQRADLNIRCELISCPPRPVFICRVGACEFISRQSALIAWHNSFKTLGSGTLNIKFSRENLRCFHLIRWCDYGMGE